MRKLLYDRPLTPWQSMPHTGHMDEIFCDECKARWINECICGDPFVTEYVPEVVETWRGMDGHKYTGDPKRASMASHDDTCGCPGSVNFDPESWY